MQATHIFYVSFCIIQALCSATNLTSQVSCENNTLTLTWDQSLVPGTTYTLQTERMGSTLPPSVHTTTNTLHMLTNLLCGQRYAFRIAAEDGNCRSSYSPSIEISTGRMCQYRTALSQSAIFPCCSRVIKSPFVLLQPLASQQISLPMWTVGQTKGSSLGLRTVEQVSTLWRWQESTAT